MKTYWEAQAQRIGPMRAAWDEDDDGTAYCLGRLAEAFDSLQPRNRLLDLGCGPGRLTVPMADRYPETEVVGYDVSPSMIQDAEQRPNVRYLLDDDLLEIGRCDGAWSILTWQHLTEFEIGQHLGLLDGFLRPDGVFLVQFADNDHAGLNSFGRNAETVSSWLADSYEIVRAEGDLLFPDWRWIVAVRK